MPSSAKSWIRISGATSSTSRSPKRCKRSPEPAMKLPLPRFSLPAPPPRGISCLGSWPSRTTGSRDGHLAPAFDYGDVVFEGERRLGAVPSLGPRRCRRSLMRCGFALGGLRVQQCLCRGRFKDGRVLRRPELEEGMLRKSPRDRCRGLKKQRALESPFEVNRADCGRPANEIRERALGGFTVRRAGRACAERKEHEPPTPPAISLKFAVRASVVYPDARSVDDRSVLPNKLEHFPSPDRIGLSFLTNQNMHNRGRLVILSVSERSSSG